MTNYDRICELENQLESARRDFLKYHGWNMTCQTPGSFWMWQRDFKGEDLRRLENHRERELRASPGRGPSPFVPYGVVTTGADTAIQMTLRELMPVDEEEGVEA